MAAYDGSLANGTRTGALGLHPLFHNDGGTFLIGEVDKSWTLAPSELAGRIVFGGWYSTNHVTRLDGGRVTGTGGPYALLEQCLWRANAKDTNDSRGVNIFLMYGYADPTILPYDHSAGGGVSWTGPIPGRDDDVCGFGVQAIHFDGAYDPKSEYEVSYELFYRVQLKPWFYVKPDVQYIANPGGKGTPDALAVTIRVQISF